MSRKTNGTIEDIPHHVGAGRTSFGMENPSDSTLQSRPEISTVLYKVIRVMGGRRAGTEHRKVTMPVFGTLDMTLDGRSSIRISRSLLPVKNQNMVWRNNKVLFTSTNLDTIETVFTVHDVESPARTAVRTKEQISLFDILDLNFATVIP